MIQWSESITIFDIFLCLYMYNYFITLQMFLKKIQIGMPKWMDGKLLGQLLYKSLRLHLHKWCVGNVSKMGWNCDVPLREPWVGVHGMKRKRGNSTIFCKNTSPQINEQRSKHLSFLSSPWTDWLPKGWRGERIECGGRCNGDLCVIFLV
jgi:hypothetical protein